MAKPQQNPQPGKEPIAPSLQVVEKAGLGQPTTPEPDVSQEETPEQQSQAAEAAARRRIHPPRVWPD